MNNSRSWLDNPNKAVGPRKIPIAYVAELRKEGLTYPQIKVRIKEETGWDFSVQSFERGLADFKAGGRNRGKGPRVVGRKSTKVKEKPKIPYAGKEKDTRDYGWK